MENLAVDLYALLGLDGPLQRHKWLWLDVVDPCSQTARYLTPPYGKDVLMAFGNDQPSSCAFPLEYGVGACRCAMVDVFEFSVPAVLVLQNATNLLYTLLHSNGLITRVRRNLCAYRFAVRGDDTDISEGAGGASVSIQQASELTAMTARAAAVKRGGTPEHKEEAPQSTYPPTSTPNLYPGAIP